MRNVLDCINAFIPLLSTEYELVLGRKGVSVTLRISFDKKDCFHLMGLQYLVDRPELSRDRGRVFDEIADGTITIPIPREYDKILRLKIGDNYMTPIRQETHNYPFYKTQEKILEKKLGYKPS